MKFNFLGFVFVMFGVVCEATRLAMVDRLLNSAEYKMDPLLSLYYFAPVCAFMNGMVALVLEYPTISMEQILNVGMGTFLANAALAFCLNLAVVFLVREILSGICSSELLIF
jgi:hypothetical protein